MYSKIGVMEKILDLRNSKCYKIGEKDLVTRDNDFEMATGNLTGVIGYRYEYSLNRRNIADLFGITENAGEWHH